MTLVTSNAWERVIKVESPDGVHLGAGTIVEHGDRTYCMTARHVLPEDCDINLLTRFAEFGGEVEPLDGVHPDADVAIFEVPDALGRPGLPLPATSDGLVLSQEAFFLGYPYGLAMRGGGTNLLPFAKRATLSSALHREDGLHIWYLDGINNPGFSGGPVVAHPAGNPGQMQFFAVISGYRPDWQEVQVPEPLEEEASDAERDPVGRVAANSGIIISYDVRHAIEVLGG